MRERKDHVSIDSKGMVATAVRENKVVIDAWVSRGGHLIYSLPLNAQTESSLPVEFVKESFRPSPFLPSSSEIIVPLRVKEKTIGALDIHSDRKDDFDQQNIFVFLPLADHIASLYAKMKLNTSL